MFQSLYWAFSRIAWSLCVAWVVIACEYDMAGTDSCRRKCLDFRATQRLHRASDLGATGSNELLRLSGSHVRYCVLFRHLRNHTSLCWTMAYGKAIFFKESFTVRGICGSNHCADLRPGSLLECRFWDVVPKRGKNSRRNFSAAIKEAESNAPHELKQRHSLVKMTKGIGNWFRLIFLGPCETWWRFICWILLEFY